jgi:hypothetical protein
LIAGGDKKFEKDIPPDENLKARSVIQAGPTAVPDFIYSMRLNLCFCRRPAVQVCTLDEICPNYRDRSTTNVYRCNTSHVNRLLS